MPQPDRTTSAATASPWRPFWLWVGYATAFICLQLIGAAVISGVRQKPVPRSTLEAEPMAWGCLVGLGLLVFLLVHARRSLKEASRV